MASEYFSRPIIYKLLNPIPPYLLACLPALAIIGASPTSNFARKLVWFFRCIGCPFTGLFYSLNIGSKRESLCIYWLSSDYFIIRGKPVEVRPFGFHVSILSRIQEHNIERCVERCTTSPSVLERGLSFVSAYYIIISVIGGIFLATGLVGCDSFPIVPILLSWTIPAIRP